MVANARHKWDLTCPRFRQLAVEVPQRLYLPLLLRADPCISDIPSEENKVEWASEMAAAYLLGDRKAQGQDATHVSKHSDADLIKMMAFQWWGLK